ncbi:protoporphyrinogen/coproporphyrinogen oxidase [Jannaschia sp. R86511]|uniref:protoporphyrinogen/coproporphyrinogen oxidase n=1 Tax=Jannaschia sp. R86511 TaxID=3093853 RepID=UPI0036D323A7
MRPQHVVVVGGGASGLAAALDLVRAGARVTVLEAGPVAGGLVRRGGLAGAPLDVGVEALLARRPEGVDLVHRLGLGDELVSPSSARPAVWRRDGVRALPGGTVMGVPGDATDLAVALRPEEVALTRAAMAARARDGSSTGGGGGGGAGAGAHAGAGGGGAAEDVSVAEAVVAEAGRAVLDVLVEPLLGGVHAGLTEELSLRSTVPALWQAWRAGRPFADAVAAAGAAAVPGAPVFTGLRGGMARLVATAVDRLRRDGAEVRTGCLVHEVRRTASGWSVHGSPADAKAGTGVGTLAADAVVLALPVVPARRLLAGPVPGAAEQLAEVPVVSVGVVALALRSPVPLRSGLLVPPGEAAAAGVRAKAVTFSSRKWDWLAEAVPDRQLVRVSYGRRGEQDVLHLADADLVALARRDLRTLLAVDGLQGEPDVSAAEVVRWGGALPQQTVGHHARVAAVRAEVAAVPGLAVAGAWLDGVGVPACIGSGRSAAAAVLA